MSGAACETGTARDGTDIDDLPALTAIEDLRIGDVADPNVGFSRIAGVTVDRGGRIYVLEGQDRHIRVYDPDGTLLRIIGGPGEGPGEFRSVTRFGFKGDTLWVNDNQLRRITMFDTNGEVLVTFTAGTLQPEIQESGVFILQMAGALRADGLLDSAFPPLFGYRPEATLPDSMMIPLLRFDRAGNVVDTTRSVAFHPGGGRSERIAVGGEQVRTPAAPLDTPLRIPVEDDLITVTRWASATRDAARFTITRINNVADTLQHDTFSYTPRPFTEAFVDSLVARSTETAVRTAGVDRAAAESALRGATDLPPFAPPISLALTGTDGTLWLRTDDDGSPTFRWIVLSADGSPRAALDLPRRLTLHWMSGDVVFAVDRDELDIPWLVRLRIGGE